MSATETRQQIVRAADKLFYSHGYEHTSFADIADAVAISRGNFYYYFKSKDDILDAVIVARLATTRSMLDQWEINGETPKERIESFIDLLLVNRAKIKLHGCPVGTLCTELAKLSHPSLDASTQLFEMFRFWLKRQFERLGLSDGADSHALHLLARSQGIAVLASAFRDDDFINREVADLKAWLSATTTMKSTRPSGKN